MILNITGTRLFLPLFAGGEFVLILVSETLIGVISNTCMIAAAIPTTKFIDAGKVLRGFVSSSLLLDFCFLLLAYKMRACP
mmetsp:Transcript_85183/g.127654  ORF Transcript_85183/g.127654 Transcript_85183/m.127654 type:complete len:81 (+) Transcript_85183:116-358(+)